MGHGSAHKNQLQTFGKAASARLGYFAALAVHKVTVVTGNAQQAKTERWPDDEPWQPEGGVYWSGREDLNLRPPGPEPDFSAC